MEGLRRRFASSIAMPGLPPPEGGSWAESIPVRSATHPAPGNCHRGRKRGHGFLGVFPFGPANWDYGSLARSVLGIGPVGGIEAKTFTILASRGWVPRQSTLAVFLECNRAQENRAFADLRVRKDSWPRVCHPPPPTTVPDRSGSIPPAKGSRADPPEPVESWHNRHLGWRARPRRPRFAGPIRMKGNEMIGRSRQTPGRGDQVRVRRARKS